MALQAAPSSTSVVSCQEKGIPTTKQMIRSTSQRFKQSSSLLQEAIQVHEERERELLSTIQKLQEQIEKFQTSQEELDGKHQKERLVDQKKICELTRGIESFSGQLKPASEDIGKICEKIFRRQDQSMICLKATISHQRWKRAGGSSSYAEDLKKTLDGEYKERIYEPDPLELFKQDTENDTKTIQRKLEIVMREFETLEGTAKTIAQELKQPES